MSSPIRWLWTITLLTTRKNPGGSSGSSACTSRPSSAHTQSVQPHLIGPSLCVLHIRERCCVCSSPHMSKISTDPESFQTSQHRRRKLGCYAHWKKNYSSNSPIAAQQPASLRACASCKDRTSDLFGRQGRPNTTGTCKQLTNKIHRNMHTMLGTKSITCKLLHHSPFCLVQAIFLLFLFMYRLLD